MTIFWHSFSHDELNTEPNATRGERLLNFASENGAKSYVHLV